MLDNNMTNNQTKLCKNCFTPNTRPRIKFNEEGICNACMFFENRSKNVDFEIRKRELKELCDKHRSTTGQYDCIVPWSGGKDSSAIAYKLKFEHNMNPLLVTFSPIIGSEVGIKNRKEFISLGFDNLFLAPDIKTNKYLSKRFFIERGDPKIHWTAGMKAVPIKTAIEKKIKLIFYAENGECLYGGNTLHEDAEKKVHLEDIIENKIGDHPLNWIDNNISERDINPYILPEENKLNEAEIDIYYYAYFEKWDVENNFKYISSKMKFLCHKDGRSPGTFTNYDSLDDHVDQVYYYLQLLKFGFGRAARDGSRLIQQSDKNYQDLYNEVERYDREVPKSDIKKYCNYISISIDEFYRICEKHSDKNLLSLGIKN